MTVRQARAATLVAMATATAVLACDRTSEFYRAIAIDPGTLVVTPSRSEGLSASSEGGFHYFRFRDARRRQSLTERLRDDGRHRWDCRDYLALDSGFVLEYRSKSQELWRGEFGSILAQTTYYYASRYATQATGFETVPMSSMGCIERPQFVDVAVDTAGRAVDAISAVLVFVEDSGYRVMTANYGARGALYAFAEGRVEPSRGEQPGWMLASGVAITYGAGADSLAARAGFAAHLDVAAVVATGVLPRAAGARAPSWQLLSVHYDHNRLVRQERVVKGEPRLTRWIAFARTYADSVLAARDGAREFGGSAHPR